MRVIAKMACPMSCDLECVVLILLKKRMLTNEISATQIIITMVLIIICCLKIYEGSAMSSSMNFKYSII